jgi:hypothetical protein
MPITNEINAMSIRLIATAALTASTLLLCSCGFVTVPLGYGGAYAGKGTVKTADKGIEYGKRSAKVVVDTAIYVSDTTIYAGDAVVGGIQKAADKGVEYGKKAVSVVGGVAKGSQSDPDTSAPRGSLRPR